jgi:hypothetical protein
MVHVERTVCPTLEDSADGGSVLKVEMTAQLIGLTDVKTEVCGLSRAAYLHIWNTTQAGLGHGSPQFLAVLTGLSSAQFGLATSTIAEEQTPSIFKVLTDEHRVSA